MDSNTTSRNPAPPPRRFTVTLFPSKTDTRGESFVLSWLELGQLLSAPHVRTNKDGSMWSPAVYGNEVLIAGDLVRLPMDGCS